MTLNSACTLQWSQPCLSSEQCWYGDTGVWKTPTPSTLTTLCTRKPQRTSSTSAGTAQTAMFILRYPHSPVINDSIMTFLKKQKQNTHFLTMFFSFFLQRQMLRMDDIDVAWHKDEEKTSLIWIEFHFLSFSVLFFEKAYFFKCCCSTLSSLPAVTSFCGLFFWPQHCAVQVWRKNLKKETNRDFNIILRLVWQNGTYRRKPFNQTIK